MPKIVRRPDRAEGGITPEEKAQLDAHAQLWIKRILRTDPIDPNKITPAIVGLYHAAELPTPNVVIVPSPLAMAFAYGAAAAIWYTRVATDGATYAATHDATHDATSVATYAATDGATNAATYAATSAATHAASAIPIKTAIDSLIHAAVRVATAKAIDATTAAAIRVATAKAIDATIDHAYHATNDATRNSINGVINHAGDLETVGEVLATTVNPVFDATDAVSAASTFDAVFDATATFDAAAIDKATSRAINDIISDTTRAAATNATIPTTEADTLGEILFATVNTIAPVIDASAESATYGAIVDAINTPTLAPEPQAATACFVLAGQLGLDCARRWNNVFQGGNMWGSYDCYLTAMRDIIGLRLPEFDKYRYWEEAAIEGGFRVMHEKFCIVSDFPEFIKQDDQHRPHCEDGPSHRWRDGWELYYWHGTRVPERWITHKNELSPKEVLAEANLEVRRAGISIIGWDRFLQELDSKVIDADADPEIGTLIEAVIPNEENPITARFLCVTCGTGRRFAVGVPPSTRTAIEAQAWFRDINPKDFCIPEVRT